MTDRTPHLIDYTSPDWSRRKDEALVQAADLRARAMADFWRGTNALLTQGVDRTARAAQRLQQRLSRHLQQRAQTVSGA